MREVNLSDHVGRLRDAVEAERRQVTAEYAQLQAALSRLGTRLVATRRARPLWKRLLRIESDEERAIVAERHQEEGRLGPIEARLAEINIRDQKLATGARGQEVLRERYLASLSDDWCLYNGLWDRAQGEIDHVLVGPTGVWAIEVKAERVLLDIDGDRWIKQRLSRSGRPQETLPAVDSGGRSWGREVAEPASALADELARRDQPVPVGTAVLLVTPLADVVRCNEPGVDLVTADLGRFDAAITGRPVLDDDQLRAIGRIVVDHHRSNERLGRRRHRPGRDRGGSAAERRTG
jgi:hypothetical protein